MEDLDTLKLEGQIKALHYEIDGCLMLSTVNHLQYIDVRFKREDLTLIKQALEIAMEAIK
jgi:hypothetical protein